MKRLLSLVLVLSLLSSPAYAECVFSRDIKEVNGKYVYTKECHIKVGELVQNDKVQKERIAELGTAFELKDLALEKSTQRLEMWRDTAFKLEDRVNTIDKVRATNNWLYFGLGIVFTGFAVWGAGQLK